MTKLEETRRAIEKINKEDPRKQTYHGKPHPREWIFSQRVVAWLGRLNPGASDLVHLAACSHTVRRWEVPRKKFPMDSPGYHLWRAATAEHSSKIAADVFKGMGYSEDAISRVTLLIEGKLFPQDPDAQLLEDADCLAFLEIKLQDYMNQWGDEKTKRILRGTWGKMSIKAHRVASELSLPKDIKIFLQGLK